MWNVTKAEMGHSVLNIWCNSEIIIVLNVPWEEFYYYS